MELSVNSLNPRLLRISYFDGYENNLSKSDSVVRKCYDYELEFYTRSDGGIIVNGEFLPFRAGTVNIRRPGQIVCGVYPYSCYILCVTFSQSNPGRQNYDFGDSANAQPIYQNPLLSSLPDKIIPANPRILETLLSSIYKIADYQDDLHQFQINSLLYQLFYELFYQTQSAEHNRYYYHPEMIRALQKIKEDFCESLSVSDLIEKSGLSKAYFHKCFKSYTGRTPNEFIAELRLNKARMLLSMTDISIASVSTACGYEDAVYFSRIFKKHTGITPSEYRLTQRNPEPLPPERA